MIKHHTLWNINNTNIYQRLTEEQKKTFSFSKLHYGTTRALRCCTTHAIERRRKKKVNDATDIHSHNAQQNRIIIRPISSSSFLSSRWRRRKHTKTNSNAFLYTTLYFIWKFQELPPTNEYIIIIWNILYFEFLFYVLAYDDRCNRAFWTINYYAH